MNDAEPPREQLIKRIKALETVLTDALKILRKNHSWHETYDEYDGYGDSDLCESNMRAIAEADFTLKEKL